MLKEKELKTPGLFEALIPIIVLIVLLALNVMLFEDPLGGPNQIVLIIAAAVATIVGLRLNMSFNQLLKGAVNSIMASMPAILILLLIGALAGTWLISGIVPSMIFYGLKVLNPTIFLVASAIVCSIVSVATGSSWSTVATVGIALLGIGKAMGIHEGLIAGAIISGAYFGDKISPMSDTTNLAPAMAGTDLFTHIRYMLYTTVPSILITLLIFLLIGFNLDKSGSVENANALSAAIETKFNITPLVFIVPAVVIWMIVKKVNAIPALLIGSLLGGIFAIIFQPQIIEEIFRSNFKWDAEKDPLPGYAAQSYSAVMNAISSEVRLSSGNEIASELLRSRGMYGMMNTIWLIITALSFGGIMEEAGLLHRITQPMVKKVRSTGALVTTTAGSCLFVNVTASDQYLSIVVPGKMFAKTYKKLGLAPQNLSRTLEDSGTVTSVLVPWNTCGATQTAVLGVSTYVYAPFAFFNIISPFMTILFAYLNIKIARLKSSEVKDVHPANISDEPEDKPVDYLQ
ncbi:MAG: Na+/H+ antiporter NhaC [Flavisolibacter sp.]|jgi:NhaC family Na+:H+ antiporter|nr:Na+/H+ antiporter NhaC [Flavisolibacter sp.]